MCSKGWCKFLFLSCLAPTEFHIPPFLQVAGTHFQSDVVPRWFLAFRSFVLLAMLWIIGLNLYHCWDDIEWYMIWLTHWTQLLCLFTVICRFCSTTIMRFGPDAQGIRVLFRNKRYWDLFHPLDSDKVPRGLRILYTVQSILTQTSLPLVSFVTCFYWMFIYYPSSDDNVLDLLDKNCLLMWLDHLVSAERYNYRAVICPICVGVLFVIWTVIYEFAIDERDYIYSVMDWSSGWVIPLIYSVASVVAGVVFGFLVAVSKNCILWFTKKRGVWDKRVSTEVVEMDDLETPCTPHHRHTLSMDIYKIDDDKLKMEVKVEMATKMDTMDSMKTQSTPRPLAR